MAPASTKERSVGAARQLQTGAPQFFIYLRQGCFRKILAERKQEFVLRLAREFSTDRAELHGRGANAQLEPWINSECRQRSLDCLVRERVLRGHLRPAASHHRFRQINGADTLHLRTRFWRVTTTVRDLNQGPPTRLSTKDPHICATDNNDQYSFRGHQNAPLHAVMLVSPPGLHLILDNRS